WILRRKLLEGMLEQTLGELHDVRLSRAMNAFAAFGNGKRKRQLYDLLTALARDQLQPLGNAGCLHVLDAGVEVLDILPDDYDVELAPCERGLDAGELAHRSNVAVSLEEGAQSDVRASVAVPDRRFKWTLEHDARTLDR